MKLKDFREWFFQSNNADTYVNLYFRWQDERYTEDINEYIQYLNEIYGEHGVKFLSADYNFKCVIESVDEKAEIYIQDDFLKFKIL